MEIVRAPPKREEPLAVSSALYRTVFPEPPEGHSDLHLYTFDGFWKRYGRVYLHGGQGLPAIFYSESGLVGVVGYFHPNGPAQDEIVERREGHGNGTALLHHLILEAESHDVRAFVVREASEKLQGFLQRRGFERVHRHINDWLLVQEPQKECPFSRQPSRQQSSPSLF